MPQVGSAGVSNFAYVTSGNAMSVVAQDPWDRLVSVIYSSGTVGGAILTEGGDFLSTEALDHLVTQNAP